MIEYRYISRDDETKRELVANVEQIPILLIPLFSSLNSYHSSSPLKVSSFMCNIYWN